MLLAGFLGLQPVTTDLYLASLPRLVDAFNSTPSAVQLTLSFYIAGFATAQLIVGPLSDRFGRRPVCLVGLTLTSLGGAMAALSPTLSVLIVARVFQSIGVCCLVVCARAIVRDQYEPAAGAQVLSKILSWMTLAPFLSPIVGGFVLQLWGWRACFVAMTVFSLLSLAACWRWQTESNHALNPHATRARDLLRTYRSFLGSREYVSYTLMLLGSYCALFSFITASSYVLIRVHGISELAYGFAFAFITLGFLTGTVLLRRLMPTGGLRLVLSCGAAFAVIGGALLLGFAWGRVPSIAAILIPMFLVMCGHGLLQPACQMGATAPFPDSAGAATALFGFTMHAVAALVGWLLSRQLDGTSLPMAVSVFASAIAINLVYLILLRPTLFRKPVLA